MDPFVTGPTIAVMFHITFGWISDDHSYVASYRDIAACEARIAHLDKASGSFGAYFRKHRYCRLESVHQPPQQVKEVAP